MFNFLWWDLKSLKAGQIVEIDIATRANVKLLTYDNFNLYKNGGRYQFHGGVAIKSPVQLDIPYDNNWVLVVDLTEPYTDLFGSMKVNSVKVKTPSQDNNIKPITVTSSPTEDTAKETTDVYDIFLSHASEDKTSVAIPLKDELEKLGLKVWIDIDRADDLSVGGLRKEIDSAIYNSKYAIIIISPDYMRKQWTNREFDGITAMEMAKKQTLLCVWHNAKYEEVLKYSPPLTDKLARKTSDHSLSEIAKGFADIISKPNQEQNQGNI